MSRRMPMFPLGSVLFPHAVLPLHIFEPRYRVLMFDCTRGEPEFGVVLIERGSEVGGDDERFAVGTVARIVAARELPDGRWMLNAVGDRRFRVTEWLPDDPYPIALVTELDEQPWQAADDAALCKAEALVRRALTLIAELGEPAPPATVELSGEGSVAAWQLAAIAPLGHLDKLRLLDVDDHRARLEALSEMTQEELSVLAYRLGRG
ncbi:MAG TPA: LON peptidase substrate-binding domain-containing protein [Acidimicrobiales bacterium]|nr:LON peptidase substrate-binding domain-containing protein [Acidimicrobiales bacterium]